MMDGLRAPVDAVDRHLALRAAHLDHRGLDLLMRGLSASADHSKLWAAVACGMVAVGDPVSRRSAIRGLVAGATASLVANQLLKRVLPRRRPTMALRPGRSPRRVPTSSSFPSGHSASAAAFVAAVAPRSPTARSALFALAATVAYSRVHTGVHHPSDVVAGLGVGAGVGILVRRRWPAEGFPKTRTRV